MHGLVYYFLIFESTETDCFIMWAMSVYEGQTCKLMYLIGLKSNLLINAMESEQVCTNDKSPLTSLVC